MRGAGEQHGEKKIVTLFMLGGSDDKLKCNYSKTCVKQPLNSQKDRKLVFKTNYHLMHWSKV